MLSFSVVRPTRILDDKQRDKLVVAAHWTVVAHQLLAIVPRQLMVGDYAILVVVIELSRCPIMHKVGLVVDTGPSQIRIATAVVAAHR